MIDENNKNKICGCGGMTDNVVYSISGCGTADLTTVTVGDDGIVGVALYSGEQDDDGIFYPSELLELTADEARQLGHALIHAAHHADEDSKPHLELVPTEDGPA